MTMSKRYYENFDCYVDPQKFCMARIKSGYQQTQIAKIIPCLSRYDISRIEKSKEETRINFGVAKAMAKLFKVNYTKFVVKVPSQIDKPTQFCKRMTEDMVIPEKQDLVETESMPINIPVCEEHFDAPAIGEHHASAIGAVPSAMIFKDASGREIKYVLADTNVA